MTLHGLPAVKFSKGYNSRSEEEERLNVTPQRFVLDLLSVHFSDLFRNLKYEAVESTIVGPGN